MIESILAHDTNFIVGQDNKIPWHHSGDFKYFRNVTDGQSVLMGAKTFIGLMEHYFKGKTVLPNRTIYVLGYPKTESPNISQQYEKEIWDLCERYEIQSTLNIIPIIDRGTEEYILSNIDYKTEKLLICGGVSVYKRFMSFSKNIHQSTIYTEASGEGLIRLDESSIDLMSSYKFVDRQHSFDKDVGAFHNLLTRRNV